MSRLVLLFLLVCGPSFAADHTVSSGDSVVDCDTFNGGVSAGDRLIVDNGTRSNITFRDCVGTSGNEIEIINNTAGQVTINCSSTYCFVMRDSEYVTVDGTNGWSGSTSGCGSTHVSLSEFASDPESSTSGVQCGFKLQCSSGGSQQMVRLQGVNTFITFQGMEIDGGYPSCRTGAPGTGFTGHDQGVNQSTNPGEFYEGNKWLHNVMYNTASECMYIGQNISTPRKLYQRSHEIAYNVMWDCGYDGIELKSNLDAGSGNSEIHHNYIATSGVGPGASNGNNGIGLSLYESGFADVYNNWVQDTQPSNSKSGNCYGTLLSNVTTSDATSLTVSYYNNVAVDCVGHGINGFRPTSAPTLTHNVYNNTIVSVGDNGINLNANITSGASIQDNISCDSAGSDISTSGSHTINNNTTSACSAVDFVSLAGRDFNIDNDVADGGNYSGGLSTDFNDVSRPQGSEDERGAFEYFSGGGGDPGDPSEIFGKPATITLDSAETHFPDHCWTMNEGSGTNLNDDCAEELTTTQWDLTITGADWETDGVHGDVLSFVKANSDYAESSSVSGLTGTTIVGIIIKIDAPTGVTGNTVVGLFDASQDDRQARLQTTPTFGYPELAALFDSTATTNSIATEVTDAEYRLVWLRISDSTIDIALDNSDWDVLADTNTGLSAAIDTLSIGRRGIATPTQYADVRVVTMFMYVNTDKTNAERNTIWNSGDLWGPLGFDGDGSGDPGPTDGSYLSGIAN